MLVIKRIKSPAQEHFNLIKDHSELHVACLSLYHYHCCEEFTLSDSILLECRKDGLLVGISFVSLLRCRSQHSITVVHKDFRNRGIGTLLLSIKKRTLNKHGYLKGSQYPIGCNRREVSNYCNW